MSIFRAADYASKKEVIHKVKLPTQAKSKVQFCRNCRRKNKDNAQTCVQCSITLRLPKLRRPFK